MEFIQRVVTKYGTVSSDDVSKKVKHNLPLKTVAIKDDNFITLEVTTMNLFKNIFDGDKQLSTVIKISKEELKDFFPHTKQLTLFTD